MPEHILPEERRTGDTLKGTFRIEGSVQLESVEKLDRELKLTAYLMTPVGEALASAPVDAKGNFAFTLDRKEIGELNLVVGPEGSPQELRNSSAHTIRVAIEDWTQAKDIYVLKPVIKLPYVIWWPWLPIRVCVSGRIRKQHAVDGISQYCPVPFVKVEVFDVDREWCIWPWLLEYVRKQPERPVIRLPKLLKRFPVKPKPWPDPGPYFERPAASFGLESVSLNPQPEPPIPPITQGLNVQFKSQPMEQRVEVMAPASAPSTTVETSISEALQNLTITSPVAPWQLLPLCFYSKKLVCTAYTDCEGKFKCCFWWFPFHFRNGRFRYDPKPDIIIKVTQIINGAPTVIYMDPYSGVRWNSTNAYVDLLLDDETVVCGNGCQPVPEGTTVFFTRVGNDYVYDINQTVGTYHGGGYSNVAYGYGLNIQAAIGKGLSEASDPYYYRLSIGPGKGPSAGPFTPLTSGLADTRVHKLTLVSESHTLGPQVVNGQAALYEIRNMKDYYWYWPDRVGYWFTPNEIPDEGIYTIRLEVFDKNGAQLTSGFVDYRDGTVAPPGPLPAMPNHCDLVLQIDNKPPESTISVPKAGSVCGVVKFKDVPFDINTSVTQENGRLRAWDMHYVKGLSGTEILLDIGEHSPAGLSPLPRNATTSSAPFTDGLTTTCAFSLVVDAYPHIRNGYGFIYHKRKIAAVAVEKCS